MVFTPSLTAALTVVAAVSRVANAIQQVTPPMEDCNLDFAESWQSGKSGADGHWCASQIKQGYTISGFRFFTAEVGEDPTVQPFLHGMDVIYTSGDWTQIGRTDMGRKTEMYWDPGNVRIDKFQTIPANIGWDQHFRSIRLITSDGQEVKAGQTLIRGTDMDKYGPTSISGNIVGISGQTGTYGIESITVHYLSSRAKNSVIHDIETSPTFDELNARPNPKDRGLEQQTLVSGHFFNEFDQTVTIHLKKTSTVTESTGWSKSTSDTGGLGGSLSVEFDVGFPEILGGTTTATGTWDWKHTTEKQNLGSKDRTETIEYWIDVPVPPKRAVHVWGYAMRGNMNVDWKGKERVTFENGKTAEFVASGKLQSTAYGDGWFHVEDEDTKVAIEGLKNGDKALSDTGEELSEEDKNNVLAKIEALDQGTTASDPSVAPETPATPPQRRGRYLRALNSKY